MGEAALRCAFEDAIAIRELVSSYAASAGQRDFAAMRATFSDDAKVHGLAEALGEQGPLAGPDEIVGFISKVMERSASVTQFPHVSNIAIDRDAATAGCDIVEYVKRRDGAGFIVMVGHYDDKFTRTSEGWRFSERNLTFRIYQQVADGGLLIAPT